MVTRAPTAPEIGENTVIAAQTGVAGSTKIGKNCVIAGQVGINGHITIADKTKIGGQAGITKSITKEGISKSGTPALELNDYLRAMSVFRKLPALEKQVLILEEKIEELISQGVLL